MERSNCMQGEGPGSNWTVGVLVLGKLWESRCVGSKSVGQLHILV